MLSLIPVNTNKKGFFGGVYLKRVIGIFFLAVLCMALGLSLDYFDDGSTSLASRYEYNIGGEYD